MGHIKEPIGVDFFVDPTPITEEDKKYINEIIAYYKATGKKMRFRKIAPRQSRKLLTTPKRKQVSAQ